MDTKQVIKHFGDRATAIERLSIYRQLFESWEKNGIPIWRQQMISAVTQGALAVDKTKNGK